MVPRALVPGPEPWKTFIRYRISKLELRRDGDWGASEAWLCTAPNITPMGSALWRSVWTAWTSVTKGLRRLKPKTHDQVLRQPLFLNPQIQSTTGWPFGTERRSNFRIWSRKGINMVRHVWSDETNSFLSSRQLYRVTKSPKINIARPEIIRACSEVWDLTARTVPKPGGWYTTTGPAPPQEFYHLHSLLGNQWRAMVYMIDARSLRLCTRSLDLQTLTSTNLTEARIVEKSATGKVLGYNPETVTEENILFPFASGRVRDLGFDPAEWVWKKMGAMKMEPFFAYTTKRGYRVIIQSQYRQLEFDRWLEAMGYSIQQRRDFFRKLWHHWTPRKISSIVWLTIADGLPLGAWRVRIGHSGICPLCTSRVLQTNEHGLFSCPAVIIAWQRLRRIRSKAGLQPGLMTWEEVLYGDLGTPNTPGRGVQDTDTLWDAGQPCSINVSTPWNIIRHALLWYIWCQHCEHDMRDGAFHIGIALFRAWQVTVQVGMGAWRELQKNRRKRNPEKHSAMEQLFLLIWCQANLFCSNQAGKPQWNPAPNHEFLPREFARRYTSARVQNQHLFTQPTQIDSQSHSDRSEDFRPPSPGAWAMALTPLAAREPDEAEQLAQAIVLQMFEDIAQEVEEETPLTFPAGSHAQALALPEDLYT